MTMTRRKNETMATAFSRSFFLLTRLTRKHQNMHSTVRLFMISQMSRNLELILNSRRNISLKLDSIFNIFY